MILTKPVQKKTNLSLTNEFLKTMRVKNIAVCRISTNYYSVKHPCLPAMFNFQPFGRVLVQPQMSAPQFGYKKRGFFRAEIMADSLDELLLKCVRLGVLHEADYKRYFKP